MRRNTLARLPGSSRVYRSVVRDRLLFSVVTHAARLRLSGSTIVAGFCAVHLLIDWLIIFCTTAGFVLTREQVGLVRIHVLLSLHVLRHRPLRLWSLVAGW